MSTFLDDDEPDERDEIARCDYCGRAMTRREYAEQGACNDCFTGEPDSWA